MRWIGVIQLKCLEHAWKIYFLASSGGLFSREDWTLCVCIYPYKREKYFKVLRRGERDIYTSWGGAKERAFFIFCGPAIFTAAEFPVTKQMWVHHSQSYRQVCHTLVVHAGRLLKLWCLKTALVCGMWVEIVFELRWGRGCRRGFCSQTKIKEK